MEVDRIYQDQACITVSQSNSWGEMVYKEVQVDASDNNGVFQRRNSEQWTKNQLGTTQKGTSLLQKSKSPPTSSPVGQEPLLLETRSDMKAYEGLNAMQDLG